jgi:hypothetical protein
LQNTAIGNWAKGIPDFSLESRTGIYDFLKTGNLIL